jgi:hypothetical protein
MGMIWLLLPPLVLLGMSGGQFCKGLRRFGIPGTAVTTVLLKQSKSNKEKVKYLLLLLLSFILAMGYGENSWLRTKLKSDKLTRVAYGILLSIPLVMLGVWYAWIVLPIAFFIRAGSFKVYKDYDWLWEDFIRYTSLGSLIIISIGG